MLLREAERLGYPLRLLRLAIATYKMPRVVRVGTAYSDLVWASRGIVAGSGNATSEMRLVMINIVDSVMKHHPTVIPTLFVDDLSIELSGEDDHILFHIAGFTARTVQRIHTDGMEVS